MDNFFSRYIDPTTDFGFKKIFGEKVNKDLTMNFLTDVLALEVPLLDITFLDKEQLPETRQERTGIYDIYCKDVAGNRFIVEMQKSRLPWVPDRMIYYSTFPIVAMAKKGRQVSFKYKVTRPVNLVRDVDAMTYNDQIIPKEWDYRLDLVYCVAVLGYTFGDSTKAVNRNSIRNDQPPHQRFSERLRFVTVELPLFDLHKPEYSLDLHLNKWLYFLNYLPDLDEMPDFYKGDAIFEKAFRVAQVANFTPAESWAYMISLKRQRDNYAALKYSYSEGKSDGIIEGKIEGKIEILLQLLNKKLGAIPPEISTAILAINDTGKIDSIMQHIFDIDDWELLKKVIKRLG